MKIKDRTGEHSEIFLRALIQSNERYRKELDEYLKWARENVGEFDFQISVTSLPRAPRERQLIYRHYDDIEIDPLENYYTMFGSGVHNVLEQAAVEGEEVEVRRGIILQVGEYKVLVHGQADYYKRSSARMEDHKYTSAWTVVKEKADHESQLNVLRFIWEENGYPVEELYNNYMFRDWSAKNLGAENYPPEQAAFMAVSMWKTQDTLDYILERCSLHIQATEIKSDELPLCTKEERWTSGGGVRFIYRTKKGDWTKRPFVCHTKADLESYKLKYADVGYKTEKILSSPKKCLHYCMAAPFCNQHRKYLSKLEAQKSNG